MLQPLSGAVNELEFLSLSLLIWFAYLGDQCTWRCSGLIPDCARKTIRAGAEGNAGDPQNQNQTGHISGKHPAYFTLSSLKNRTSTNVEKSIWMVC